MADLSIGAWIGGLATLAAGAVINAALNRARDDRIRAIEISALIDGLSAEIDILIEGLIFDQQYLADDQYAVLAERGWQQENQPHDVYSAATKDIGKLGSAIHDCVKFYGHVWTWHKLMDDPTLATSAQARGFNASALAAGRKALQSLIDRRKELVRSSTIKNWVTIAFDVASAGCGLVAAYFWLVSAWGDVPPAPGAAFGGTSPTEPFNMAMQHSAAMNRYAAILTGISVLILACGSVVRAWSAPKN